MIETLPYTNLLCNDNDNDNDNDPRYNRISQRIFFSSRNKEVSRKISIYLRTYVSD